VQFLCKVTDTLLIVLKVYAQQQQIVQTVMYCFVVFIQQHKNDFLVFLPRVNQVVCKHKIYNNQYRDCLGILLKFGSFSEINSLMEGEELSGLVPTLGSVPNLPYIVELKDAPLFRKIDAASLINEFDTRQKILKED